MSANSILRGTAICLALLEVICFCLLFVGSLAGGYFSPAFRILAALASVPFFFCTIPALILGLTNQRTLLALSFAIMAAVGTVAGTVTVSLML